MTENKAFIDKYKKEGMYYPSEKGGWKKLKNKSGYFS